MSDYVGMCPSALLFAGAYNAVKKALVTSQIQ